LEQFANAVHNHLFRRKRGRRDRDLIAALAIGLLVADIPKAFGVGSHGNEIVRADRLRAKLILDKGLTRYVDRIGLSNFSTASVLPSSSACARTYLPIAAMRSFAGRLVSAATARASSLNAPYLAGSEMSVVRHSTSAGVSGDRAVGVHARRIASSIRPTNSWRARSDLSLYLPSVTLPPAPAK
jgi:hypothetical protein